DDRHPAHSPEPGGGGSKPGRQCLVQVLVRDLSTQPARAGGRLSHRFHARHQLLHDARDARRKSGARDVDLHRAAGPVRAELSVRRDLGRGADGVRDRHDHPGDASGRTEGLMHILLRVVVGLVVAFLVLPLIFVVVSSFGASAVLVFPPKAFTLGWYRNINPAFVSSLKTSLIVATATAFIATVVGTGAAVALARGRFSGLRALGVFTLSPLMVPTLVTAVALFQFTGFFWDLTGIELAGTLMGIVLGHTAYAIPYVVRAVVVGHSHFDYTLEEAALSLGASRWRTLASITLPVLLPGIISGTLFAFLVSLDDLPIALFMTGGESTTTLPVKIYTSIEFSLSPDVMAISALLVYGSLGLVLLLDRTLGLEKIFGGSRTY